MSAGGKEIILAFNVKCIMKPIEPFFRDFLTELLRHTTVKLFILSTSKFLINGKVRNVNESREHVESFIRNYFSNVQNTVQFATDPSPSVLYTKKTIDAMYDSIPGATVREPAYFIDKSMSHVTSMRRSGISSFYIGSDSMKNDFDTALDSILRDVYPPLRVEIPKSPRMNTSQQSQQSPFILPPLSPFVLPPLSPFVLSPSTPVNAAKGGRRTRRTNVRKSRKHRTKK